MSRTLCPCPGSRASAQQWRVAAGPLLSCRRRARRRPPRPERAWSRAERIGPGTGLEDAPLAEASAAEMPGEEPLGAVYLKSRHVHVRSRVRVQALLGGAERVEQRECGLTSYQFV